MNNPFLRVAPLGHWGTRSNSTARASLVAVQAPRKLAPARSHATPSPPSSSHARQSGKEAESASQLAVSRRPEPFIGPPTRSGCCTSSTTPEPRRCAGRSRWHPSNPRESQRTSEQNPPGRPGRTSVTRIARQPSRVCSADQLFKGCDCNDLANSAPYAWSMSTPVAL